MQTNTTPTRILAAVFIVAFSIGTVTDAEKVSPCCVAVSRIMEDVPIIDYRLQEKSLPCIKAVVFLTERDHFCIDPYQPWVKRKILEIRRSQKNKMSPTPTSLPQTFSTPQNSTASTQREEQQTTAH